jgi:hypothetical protein
MSTSLDFEDAEFVRQVPGTSDSEKLAKIVKAARLGGLTIGDHFESTLLDEFVEWLEKRKTKFSKELHEVLTEFLQQ